MSYGSIMLVGSDEFLSFISNWIINELKNYIHAFITTTIKLNQQ